MRLRQHIYASVRGCEQQLPVVGGEGGAEIVLRLSEFGRLFIVCWCDHGRLYVLFLARYRVIARGNPMWQ